MCIKLDIMGYISYNVNKEFIQKYQTELTEMWETETYVKLPPLN